MMKIIQIIPSLNKGGAERIALDICIELQVQGHEVLLVTLHDKNQYSFLSESINCLVVKTDVKLSILRKNQVNIQELQKVIDAFNPDIIHSHLFESELNLAFCEIPTHCKRLVHFHDNMKQMKKFTFQTWINKELFTQFYERHLVLKNLRIDSIAIAISKNTFNFIQRNLFSKVQIELLHNAIDTKRFVPGGKNISGLNLIMIGSFVAKKGQILAIQTIQELKSRNVNAKLCLIGDGVLKNELIELTEEMNLTDNVEFLGNIDFPETYLQQSNIYLHTASYEPFGLVLIEAMACGLPVVCTDGFGNRDLIQEGKNGFLIKERNPKLLADKIQYLIENQEEIERMRENAIKFAQSFGMEKYVTRLEEVYKK